MLIHKLNSLNDSTNNNDTLTLINEEQNVYDSSKTAPITDEQRLQKSEDSLKSVDPQRKKSKKEEKLQGKKININNAPKEELMLLPGVGESMAEKIILYRQEHKGFKKNEDMMKVKGIGKKKFEKLKDYITKVQIKTDAMRPYGIKGKAD